MWAWLAGLISCRCEGMSSGRNEIPKILYRMMIFIASINYRSNGRMKILTMFRWTNSGWMIWSSKMTRLKKRIIEKLMRTEKWTGSAIDVLFHPFRWWWSLSRLYSLRSFLGGVSLMILKLKKAFKFLDLFIFEI